MASTQTSEAKKAEEAKKLEAKKAEDMAVPNWRLHALQGKLAGHWAATVNGNWRLTFRFENGDAHLVDYQDYH